MNNKDLKNIEIVDARLVDVFDDILLHSYNFEPARNSELIARNEVFEYVHNKLETLKVDSKEYKLYQEAYQKIFSLSQKDLLAYFKKKYKRIIRDTRTVDTTNDDPYKERKISYYFFNETNDYKKKIVDKSSDFYQATQMYQDFCKYLYEVNEESENRIQSKEDYEKEMDELYDILDSSSMNVKYVEPSKDEGKPLGEQKKIKILTLSNIESYGEDDDDDNNDPK